MVQISTLLAVVVTLAAVSPSAAFQASSFTPARVHLRSAACHASSRAAGAPALQMGFRDNAKKVVSVVGAVVTIAFGVPRVAKADSPRVLLPSQEAYSLHQQELADGTYKPLPLKVLAPPYPVTPRVLQRSDEEERVGAPRGIAATWQRADGVRWW